jgi:hypothetical protein
MTFVLFMLTFGVLLLINALEIRFHKKILYNNILSSSITVTSVCCPYGIASVGCCQIEMKQNELAMLNELSMF